MKKRICLVVFLIATSLTLSGCNGNNVDENKNEPNDISEESEKEVGEANTKLQLHRDLKEISISKSEGFMKVNSDFIKTFKNKEEINLFQEIMTSATRVAGIVDLIEPEFDLEVTYVDESKQGFHLWLGEDGERSSFMKVDDTHTLYTISEEINSELVMLIDLVK